ncbi:MAG: hypothetical protein J6E44_04760 [Lachnospiraceae bacterium]|nr:hypothetical protein [Lachnospiraceae bacterium]
MKRNKNLIAAAVCAAAVLAVILLVVPRLTRGSTGRDQALIEQGIAYLRDLESRDISVVQNAVKEVRMAKARAQVEERLAKLENDELDLWACFDDAVILGDSRADDFEYNGFLPRSKILAALGDYCLDAEDYLDQVEETNPSQIIFTYGMNDVDGIWNNAEDFISAYAKVINEFRDRVPNAEYYVCSIIPANQHAIDNDPNYENIPEYNDAIRQMCTDLNVVFIDLDDLMVGHEDLYDTDGQHFFPELYPLWAKSMLRSIFEYEGGLMGEQAAEEAEEFLETDVTDSTGEA